MPRMIMTRGKYEGICACADSHGIIAAAAMDQRGSLQKAIAKARGAEGKVSAEDLTLFKTAVVKVLTRHATAILLDPEYGLPALKEKDPMAGVLLAYEKTGYDAAVRGRMPDLMAEWSALRLKEAGANAVKILLYYNPNDEARINRVKQAFIERIGAECRAVDLPFFLEPLYYDDALDEKGLELAQRKPENVTRTMEEFSQQRYGVDVLKVEVPVNMEFVEGTRAFAGVAAYSRAEAMEHFRNAAGASKKPFIYLSAGVSDEISGRRWSWLPRLARDSPGCFAGEPPGRRGSLFSPMRATMPWWIGWRTKERPILKPSTPSWLVEPNPGGTFMAERRTSRSSIN